MKIGIELLTWYRLHKRALPWRGLREPYAIWLSEIILQQTRVEQGRPYYERFMRLFPTVAALAQADEDQVLKAWEGLGYYSRARNLHKAAKRVHEELGGIFPQDYEGLLHLPGVGAYTAAAIASICYDEAVVVVDGNVNRLIARLYSIHEEVYSSAGRKAIRAQAQALLEEVQAPGDFNQALMEFGALQCVPKNPDCRRCPLMDRCRALRQGEVNLLPIKKKAKASTQRYLTYHVALDQGHTYLRKRGPGDVWAGLYEFLLVEGAEAHQAAPEAGGLIHYIELKHVLSHQDIYARFLVYEGPPRISAPDALRCPLGRLGEYPFSRLSTRFLELSDISGL